MKKTLTIAMVILILSFAAGIYLYPSMPDKMASHWNAAGEVDGYMSKFWGVFLLPIILTVMITLFVFLPKIDPLRKNVEKFRSYFDGFILVMTLFLVYIYALTIAWNLSYRFNMTTMILPAMAILFFYSGVLLENAKRNWFIGIKTPWTISSDVVWKKTHKLAAKMFKVAAIIVLFGVFLPDYGLFFLIPMLIAAIYPIYYSYKEFKKSNK